MDLEIVENALPPSLPQEIKDYSFTVRTYRTNLTSWNPNLVSSSGTILLYDLQDEMLEKVKAATLNVIGGQYADNPWSVIYTLGSRMSWLPWHEDSNHLRSMTIYLNQEWSEDYAGYLLYKDEEHNVRAVLPTFNRGVVFTPPVSHCTVMPNLHAPLRESLQIFVNKKRDSA